MLFNARRRLRLALVASLVASGSTACSTALVVVPPRDCPVMSEATVLELTDMELKGTYGNTREWVLDQMVPYCDGIEAMRKDWVE